MNQEEFFESMADTFLAEWRDYVNCNQTSVELWLDPELGSEAQTVCNGCAVQLECIDDAIRWGDGGHRGLPEAVLVKVSRHRKRYNKLFEYDMNQAGISLEGEM